MATFTVDLPAYGCLAPSSGVRVDDLATTDTATEIVTDTVFQDIAVGTYGGGAYDPAANVILPTLPDGATITAVNYVTIAYRESGSDLADMGGTSGLTPRDPHNEPFLYLNSNVRSPLFLLDDLPIGGYAGEIISPAAESYVNLQLNKPMNRAWLSYHTSTSPPPIHVAYLAIRITYTTRPAATTRRKYPNPTGLGVGTRRHWPKPRRGVTGIQ